jgi:hypothetical protein
MICDRLDRSEAMKLQRHAGIVYGTEFEQIMLYGPIYLPQIMPHDAALSTPFSVAPIYGSPTCSSDDPNARRSGTVSCLCAP